MTEATGRDNVSEPGSPDAFDNHTRTDAALADAGSGVGGNVRGPSPGATAEPAKDPGITDPDRSAEVGDSSGTLGAGPMAHAAARMGLATALSRLLGFVRVLVIAAVLGTTALGDTFQGANSISNVLFELLAAGALSAVLIPTFTRLFDNREQAEAERLSSSLLGIAVLLLGLVSIIGMLFSDQIAAFLTATVRNADQARLQRDLARQLLLFFIPQVVLYGIGAVAIAILRARRQFVVTAIAPIGNTVLMVFFLGLFYVARDGNTSLPVTTGQMLLLAAAGTTGVAAFVAIPRPSFDPTTVAQLRLGGWAAIQNAMVGILLAGAIYVGAGANGGVVAYQVAWVLFLLPYAVLAQPLHEIVLPEITIDAAKGHMGTFVHSASWAFSGMTMSMIPAAVVYCAFGGEAMRAAAFGATNVDGARFIAAALAGLAVGLPAYAGFMLLTRTYYALGEAQVPAVVGLISALVGVIFMVGVAAAFTGETRMLLLGFGQSLAYYTGCGLLAVGIRMRTGGWVLPDRVWRTLAASVLLAGLLTAGYNAIDPETRIARLACLAGVGIIGGAAYIFLVRRRLFAGRLPQERT
jgi:putative peptidoglycan lipid II flippase